MTGCLLVVAGALTLLRLHGVHEHAGARPEAGHAMDLWYAARAWPDTRIPMEPLTRAFREQAARKAMSKSAFPGSWSCIGPMNFGGRLLCLAFNPQNPNTLLAGSASGGLWRSYSGGTGADAWQPVPTGFPVIGVGAVAFHPADSNILFVGTGEVYNYQNTGTGVAVRTTRGTYGIGILRSTDGGSTWSSSLNWQYDDMRGVQDIVINPLNPSTVFAATTEGTYRSLDGGGTWQLVHGVLMATDVLMIPGDTATVLVAAGNNGSSGMGIFRSVNGGSTFTKVTAGLPAVFTGKALLAGCMSQPNKVFATIANQQVQIGLFRSLDYGQTWTTVNTTDVAKHQGWYSHDVAVRPDNANEMMFVGIDAWRSFNGGTSLTQRSYWYKWDFSATPVGGPEGPPDYMHGDIHHVYYHPAHFDTVYFVTDGGLFISDDAGSTFSGANGMLHCQQFYADISCSPTDSLFVIGGLQDNATPVYEGGLSWRRVIGGDGLSTAIDPGNDNVVYASYQYLNIHQSIDKAQTFNFIANFPGGSSFCFAGPFAVSPANSFILYAGSDVVFKSTNSGFSWQNTNGGSPVDGNPVLRLACSYQSIQVVYAATAPVNFASFGLFRTANGGASWSDVTGTLPNRYILDVVVHPLNDSIVYAALGGFGTAHLYRTADAGSSWQAIGSGLADVPLNTLAIDPLNPLIVYAGNDLGVFASIDGGQSFTDFNDGLYDATLVFDIAVSPSNRMLRLGTHGKGAWERPMLPAAITPVPEKDGNEDLSIQVQGNPVGDALTLLIARANAGTVVLEVYDLAGRRMVRTAVAMNPGLQAWSMDVRSWPAGVYCLGIRSGTTKQSIRVVKR